MSRLSDAQRLSRGSLDPALRTRRREASQSLRDALRAGKCRVLLTVYCSRGERTCQRAVMTIYGTPEGLVWRTDHPEPRALFDAAQPDGREVRDVHRGTTVDALAEPSSLPEHPEHVPGWCPDHGVVLLRVAGLRDLVRRGVHRQPAVCDNLGT